MPQSKITNVPTILPRVRLSNGLTREAAFCYSQYSLFKRHLDIARRKLLQFDCEFAGKTLWIGL